MLADWFARNNVDETGMFIPMCITFPFKVRPINDELQHSNLEVCFTSAPYTQRYIYSRWSCNNPSLYWGAFLSLIYIIFNLLGFVLPQIIL